MEQNKWKSDPQETRGWEIVKQLNEGLKEGHAIDALSARKLLAEYFKLETARPSRLHSAILSCAVKMAMVFSDFHFVPFLDIWGLQNLRPEDSEEAPPQPSPKGEGVRRFPSLVERMTKAYAYSLMFHPEERLEPELERTMKNCLPFITHAIATRVFQSEVRNRKMTFVSLLTPEGDELITEVHTLTQFSRMRYEDITNRMFRVILRSSDKGKQRIEAAVLSNEKVEECFQTSVGYVEHLDGNHHHIHVYDNESRHMVAKYGLTCNVKEGDFVRFVPVIPKEGNFKSAVITSLCSQDDFGYRNAQVTYVSEDQSYCSWELLPEADGQIHPIVETNAKDQQEPASKGYISKQVIEKNHLLLPKKGDKLQIITFLKRGKDGKKKPFVVWFKL